MTEYFPKWKSFRTSVRVELDLSNYATKAYFKNATGIDTLDFAKKTDLASLKSDVDKLDIDTLKNVLNNLSNLKSKDKLDVDQLVPIPAGLCKLSDVVKNNVELDLSNYATKAYFKNVTGIDALDFAKKTDLASLKFDVDKLDIDTLQNILNNLTNLKSKVDKLDVDKLVPIPAGLCKLSDVVKRNVFKKTEYDKLVKKMNMMN